jgi:hypothetical protein
MVFKTWDLNFGAWIFTLTVSKTETWKLLRRDFQDVGSQFWDLDFTQGLHSGLRPRAPTNIIQTKKGQICHFEWSKMNGDLINPIQECPIFYLIENKILFILILASFLIFYIQMVHCISHKFFLVSILWCRVKVQIIHGKI